jgi:predicted transcriptional regulator
LEKEKFIKSKNDGLYKRFYPYEMKIPKFKHPEYIEIQLSRLQESIVEIIRAKPGITQKELAGVVGASPQVVNYHIGLMASFEIIKRERVGNKTKCFVNRLYRIDAKYSKPLEVE